MKRLTGLCRIHMAGERFGHHVHGRYALQYIVHGIHAASIGPGRIVVAVVGVYLFYDGRSMPINHTALLRSRRTICRMTTLPWRCRWSRSAIGFEADPKTDSDVQPARVQQLFQQRAVVIVDHHAWHRSFVRIHRRRRHAVAFLMRRTTIFRHRRNL